MTDLTDKTCKPCEGGVAPLTPAVAKKLLGELKSGWDINSNSTEVSRTFEFKNYYRTIAFVNVIAWMAQKEKHHPDLEVSYNHCKVRYQTHAINGLSENDFICAAKVDEIYMSAPN